MVTPLTRYQWLLRVGSLMSGRSLVIRINLQVPYLVINIVYLLILFILSVSFSLSSPSPSLFSPPLDSNQSVLLISCEECEERRAEYSVTNVTVNYVYSVLHTHTHLYLYINLIFNLITSFIPCKILVIAHFTKVYQWENLPFIVYCPCIVVSCSY